MYYYICIHIVVGIVGGHRHCVVYATRLCNDACMATTSHQCEQAGRFLWSPEEVLVQVLDIVLDELLPRVPKIVAWIYIYIQVGP